MAGKKKSCFIVGGTPNHFPWGYDEEHPHCERLRTVLKEEILKMIKCSYTTFYSDCSQGVGIWAAEEIVRQKRINPNLRLILGIPFEAQAARWPNEIRERYFTAQEQADEFICFEKQYHDTCIFSCFCTLTIYADAMIAVYGGEPIGIIADTVRYAINCGKKVQIINPDTSKTSPIQQEAKIIPFAALKRETV